MTLRFYNFSIKKKIVITTSSLLAIIFCLYGGYIYFLLQQYIIESIDSNMQEQVNNLNDLVRVECQGNSDKIEMAMHMAQNYLLSSNQIVESKVQYIDFPYVNKEGPSIIKLKKWFLNGKLVHNNTEISEVTRRLGVAATTIFQKSSDGYIRICTNVKNTDGSWATGTILPHDSPVVQGIEKNGFFKGRAWVVNEWYLTAYEPIISGGRVMGIISVGMPEKNMVQINHLFANKKFFNTGHPSMIGAEGEFIIHPTLKGVNVKEMEFFSHMLNHKSGNIIKHEFKFNGVNIIQYFKYFEPIDAFITADCPKKEIQEVIEKTQITILIATILGVVLVILILSTFIQSIILGISKGGLSQDHLSTKSMTPRKRIELHSSQEIGSEVDNSHDNLLDFLKLQKNETNNCTVSIATNLQSSFMDKELPHINGISSHLESINHEDSFTADNSTVEFAYDSKEIIKNLNRLMIEEKVFLNPSLNLGLLSFLLNTKPETITKILNQELNQGFWDYINLHRIEEFKRIYQNDLCNHLSIIGIANECGFKSKATFYRAFKKFENTSPTSLKSKVS